MSTVTYRLRAKGATVEKAAERAGQMLAQGPWRYFEAVEDRAVRCDWRGKTIPYAWGLATEFSPRYGTGGAISQAVTFHGHVRCFLQ